MKERGTYVSFLRLQSESVALSGRKKSLLMATKIKKFTN